MLASESPGVENQLRNRPVLSEKNILVVLIVNCKYFTTKMQVRHTEIQNRRFLYNFRTPVVSAIK